MNYYEAIKITALRSVMKPDVEYFLRRIYRWYSKTFHVSLIEAFDIPIEEILIHFYEEKFEVMEEADLEAELDRLLETDEERKNRLLAEDLDKVSEFQLLEMSNKRNESNLKDKAKKIADLTLPKEINNLTAQLKEINETLKKEPPKVEAGDIDMKFESDEDWEKMLDNDSNLASLDKGKKP